MKKVVISSDSCLDEFKTTLTKLGVKYKSMAYVLNKEFRDEFSKQEEYDAFYQLMKEGAMPTTSMLNSFEMEEYFEKIIQEDDADIVHISLSSGLSGTYDNTKKAAEAINEKYPKNQVYVVDSLCASQGQNYLVNLGIKERDKGKTAESIYNELQEAKHKLQTWFMINDLFHLRRGGRISNAKAVIGTMLQTKPILTFNTAGKLDINTKAVGTKKALKLLANKLEEMGLENKEQDVYIATADCFDDAELLKKFILKRFSKVNVLIKNIGPVIGSHTGAGALGVIFKGNKRLKPIS